MINKTTQNELETGYSAKADDYCPGTSGETYAYGAQWLDVDVWRDIPTEKSKAGIPGPAYFGDLFGFIGLMGYEQAQAIAWSFSACAKAEGKDIKIRVAKYVLTYSIKARQMESCDSKE